MNIMILNDLKNTPEALGVPYTTILCALSAFSVILTGVFISRDFSDY
jgi:hypothetical protein